MRGIIDKLGDKWPGVVALIAAIFAAGLAITFTHDDSGTSLTVTVNAKPHDGVPTTTVEVPKAAVEQAAPVIESNLKNPPAVTSPAVLDRVQAEADRNRRTTEALPTAGASASVPGCVTRFVANQSSRRGVRPRQHWLHYTVSANRPGWSDVNAIVALFNRPSFAASSHFVIDAEGNCAYIVPLEAKAWTQAAANPFAVSYEIIATGREADYLQSAGYAKLRSVMRTVSARTGIPLTQGTVVNCLPRKFGIVQHRDGGLCSGGHHDIGPFSLGIVIGKLAFNRTRPVPARWHSRCRRLNATRAKIKARQHVSTAERRKAHELRVALVKGHYSCSGARAVRNR